MSWENERAVCAQIENAGLLVEGGLCVGTVKPVRCKVDGERGRKGWYWLSEFPLDDGVTILTGAFGIWHGEDNGQTNIHLPERVCEKCGAVMRRTRKTCPECKSTSLRTHEITREQRTDFRRKLAERKRSSEIARKKLQAKAAAHAVKKWRALNRTGKSGYLPRKQIEQHGARFTADGAVVVPVNNTSGDVQGLQFILDRDNPAHRAHIEKNDHKDKKFWPYGMAMQGSAFILGAIDPTGVNLVSEGFATCGSLRQATGRCAVVVFNANNLLPAIKNLVKLYPRAHWLICADDDYLCRCRHCRKQTLVADHPEKHPSDRTLVPCEHCGEPHEKINTGVTVAMRAAAALRHADWCVPEFASRVDEKTGKHIKWTDFNDLHCEENLQVVSTQLDEKITALGWDKPKAAALPEGAQNRGAGKALKPILSVDEACARFSLVNDVKDLMYDHQYRKLMPKSCVMDIIPDHGWREWKQRPDRKLTYIDRIGFDPAETDTSIECNLWAGWPTVPSDKGSCDKLLELLEYMCSEEDHPREVFRWVLRWLAYPIQYPGIKMKTALVIHGGQGVGKNLFFEAYMAIFGEYGRVIGQVNLEDRFNEWAGRKLFLIANEVIARADLFHQKNKVKALITDDWIRINPKNVAAHDERNHMNLVFLSNEAQPVVLDPDDRRFMAVWTPQKRNRKFYKSVLDDIHDGGIAALHQYLLDYDLGDFEPGTPPMTTRARTELIELGKESPDRFIEAWMADELDIPCQACALADLYSEYDKWCRAEGERFSYAKNKFSAKIKINKDVEISKKAVVNGSGKPRVMRVVLPADDPKPDTEPSWMKWLGPRISSFKSAISEKGGF